MTKNAFFAMVVILSMLLGGLLAYLPLNSHFKAKIKALEPKVIEVIKRDTITQIYPIEIENRVLVRDTIKIAIVDTLVKMDTLYLPREQKVYGDSTYRAVVSGIQPRLDSIQVFNKTIVQTKIATQKEWRKFDYGVQVGVGTLFPIKGEPTMGAYVGFGVSYHF